MVFTDDYEMSEEVARAVRLIAPATAFFIKNLARIVDITSSAKETTSSTTSSAFR
jgi:hypothetical protein